MKRVTVVYGRMNPLTEGHLFLVRQASLIEAEEVRVYLTSSFDSKRNPLDPIKKLEYATEAFSALDTQMKIQVTNKVLPDIFESLVEDGFTDAHLMVGEDRVETFQKMVERLNLEDLNIKVLSAGKRDVNSSNYIETVSSSQLRELASKGMVSEFMKHTPSTLTPESAYSMYRDVVEGLDLTEELFSRSRQKKFKDMYIVTQFCEEEFDGNVDKFFSDALSSYHELGQFKSNHRDHLLTLFREKSTNGIEKILKDYNDSVFVLARFAAELWSESLGEPSQDAIEVMTKIVPFTVKGGRLEQYHPGEVELYRGTDKKKTIPQGYVLAHSRSIEIAKKYGTHIITKHVDRYIPAFDIDRALGKSSTEDEVVVFYNSEITETHVNARYATDYVVGEEKKKQKRLGKSVVPHNIGTRSDPTGIAVETVNIEDPDDLGYQSKWSPFIEEDGTVRTGTYAYLKLHPKSQQDLFNWVESQPELKDFDKMSPEEFHCTVFYSYDTLPVKYKGKSPVNIIVSPSTYRLQVLGNALVIRFESAEVRLRHKYISTIGLKYTHDQYMPHVSLVYAPKDEEFDPLALQPDRCNIALNLLTEKNALPTFPLWFKEEVRTYHRGSWKPGDGLAEQKELRKDIKKGLSDDPSGLGEYKPGAEATEELEPMRFPSRNVATTPGSLIHKQLQRRGSFYDYEYDEETNSVRTVKREE